MLYVPFLLISVIENRMGNKKKGHKTKKNKQTNKQTYKQTNTNNVNKTTGGKEEPNIVFMRNGNGQNTLEYPCYESSNLATFLLTNSISLRES